LSDLAKRYYGEGVKRILKEGNRNGNFYGGLLEQAKKTDSKKILRVKTK